MISTTKRLLINEWITSSEDSLRELSFDDTIVETIFEFLDNPDSDLEVCVLLCFIWIYFDFIFLFYSYSKP